MRQSTLNMGAPLELLVVDDSAIVRRAIAMLLEGDQRIRVTTTPDAIHARERIRLRKPDVILLDIVMPRMDGVTFLKELMSTTPIPVVICSSVAGPGSEQAMRALEAGAVAIINKPRLGVREYLEGQAEELVRVLHGAAGARLTPRQARRAMPVTPQPTPSPRPIPREGNRSSPFIIAIGASTGGPEAIRSILAAMPTNSPPIVVVQHMPAGFTASFAKRLNQQCAIHVREACDGDPLETGTALLAAGDRHLEVVWRRNRWEASTYAGPPVSRHCPSVDVLLNSVAATHGRRGVGVLLTGMGDDGARGLLAMRKAGAYTLAEHESSCVVFGMPKAAIQRGAASDVLPLRELIERLQTRISGRPGTAA